MCRNRPRLRRPADQILSAQSSAWPSWEGTTSTQIEEDPHRVKQSPITVSATTAGGSVTNQSGGAISGYGGIIDEGSIAVTVVNAGRMAASGNRSIGVDLIGGAGSVTNQSGGSIIGNEGIYADSALTVVNAGRIKGSSLGVYLRAGGSVTNQSGGTISGYDGIYGMSGAVTVVNAGTISGSSYAVKFAAGYVTNRLIADPGAVFTGKINGGGGILELASAASAGTLVGFGISITNFTTLQFDAGAAWTVSGNDSASSLGTIAIADFANGDTIDLTGIGLATAETFANGVLTLTSGSNTYTLDIETPGPSGTADFALSSDGNGGTDVVVCFAAGTQIGTPDGEGPVEKLQTGDLVLTAHNGSRTVKWIGHGKVLATRGRRTAATPVIVLKSALANNVPNRDPHVTKAHSLYIDDVLIPVEFLVNHRTILWDDRAQEVEIYHVELDSHNVLIANGAPAESYRDDGNRWLFQNANAGWHLPPQDPYAPVLTGGPVVDAAWRRLLDRAGPRALPPMTDDPDLHLVVDGVRVEPQQRDGSVYQFRLPCRPASVVIASREVVPAEFGIARDPRSLGVALRQVAIWQDARVVVFDAADERLTVGFHAYETDCGLRWTDGRAELPAEAFARFGAGAEVVLRLGGATQYPDDRANTARAAA
jgi:antigen 43